MYKSNIDYEALFPGYKRPENADKEVTDEDIEKIGQFLLLLRQMEVKNEQRKNKRLSD